jgi:hypothetical protein
MQELKMMMKEEKQHSTKRHEFQEEMITNALNAGNKERARIIRRIQRAEVLKVMWSKCAAARGYNKQAASLQ